MTRASCHLRGLRCADTGDPCERHKAIREQLETPEGQARLRAVVKAHVMGANPPPEERAAPAAPKPAKPTTKQGDLFA